MARVRQPWANSLRNARLVRDLQRVENPVGMAEPGGGGWVRYEATAAKAYLHEVADLASAEIRNDDSTSLAPVAAILNQREEFLDALDRFLDDLNR